jgi:hypothetical protein
VAKVSISYRSSEAPFICDILARLDRSHDIRAEFEAHDYEQARPRPDSQHSLSDDPLRFRYTDT